MSRILRVISEDAPLLGGWHPRTDGRIRGEFVHDDRFRPQDLGLWDHFSNGRTSWLINGGY